MPLRVVFKYRDVVDRFSGRETPAGRWDRAGFGRRIRTVKPILDRALLGSHNAPSVWRSEGFGENRAIAAP